MSFSSILPLHNCGKDSQFSKISVYLKSFEVLKMK